MYKKGELKMNLFNYEALKDFVESDIREVLDGRIRREEGMFDYPDSYINYSEFGKRQ